MKLKITTLVIVEEGQVQDIYHSLEDNQDKAYQGILRNRTYRDSRTNINRIQNSHPKQRNQMKRNPRTKYTYLTRINGMNTFLLQVNQTPITTQTQVQPSTSTYVPKTN